MAHERPNIVFIMADDHTCSAISAYGSRTSQTPGIDRLGREGVRFTNCVDVNALCAPSRATILTGKHSHANGFYGNADTFDGSQATFAKLLRSAGYSTGIIGKWHLRSRPTGFDYFNVLPGHGRFWNPVCKESGAPWEDGNAGGTEREGYLTDIITDESIRWIESVKDSGPFCCLVHHKAPHTPHEYPQRFESMYRDTVFPEPDSLLDDYHGRRALDAAKHPHTRLDWVNEDLLRRFGWKEPLPEITGVSREEKRRRLYQRFAREYLRLAAALDENVGRLLEYIDEAGLAENTVVVYTSDNGYFLGEHGLFNKQWMYTPAHTVPLFVRYPREVTPGRVEHGLVGTIDFGPTFLDWAGIQTPGDMHGRSFRRLATTEGAAPIRERIYYHYYGQYGVPEQTGIRTLRHKIIHFHSGPAAEQEETAWECYDLEVDPEEMRNLVLEPDQSRRIERLRMQYHDEKGRVGDSSLASGPNANVRVRSM
jgi:arylsulfatase A-like enzyme